MSPRALANQERELQSRRMSKLGRSALLLIATLLSFATIGLLVVDQLYRPEAFVIDQLIIKGKFRHLQPSQVEQTVKQAPLGNFFSVDLEDIKDNVESLAWVQNADVRREWPNTLLINVSEHRPVLPFKISQSNNENYWLTSLGNVIDLPAKFEIANTIKLSGKPRDSKLILNQTYKWKKLIDLYGLRLTNVELSASHAWQLRLSYLDHEFDLLLGRIEIEQRLSRFLLLFDSQFKGSDQQITRVDARYPNGLAIKSETIKPDEDLAVVMFEESTLTQENNTR